MPPKRPISLDDLDQLELDEQNRLYWRGHLVVTKMQLPWYVDVAIIAAGMAAVIAAVWPIIRFFAFGS